MSDVLNEDVVSEEPTTEDLVAAGALKVDSRAGVDETAFCGTVYHPEGVPEDEVHDLEIPEVDPEVAKVGQAALQIAMQLGQIAQTGEQIVMLLVKPELVGPFEAAFRAVPDNILPADFRDNLPITPDPECEGVRIITRSDLVQEFLVGYYGPVQNGGNGLLQNMQEAISRIPNCPVRIDLKALELFFLLEIKERVKPGLIVPTGASLHQGMPPDIRRR